MKNAKVFAVILLLVSFTFTNCSPDQDHLFTTNEIITRGNWGVEFFINNDKTTEYADYVFQFSGNGTFTGTDGTHTTEGSWSVIRDVDRTDLLTISISDQTHMTELNNSWSVKGKSAVALKLLSKNASEVRIHKL